MPLNIDIQQILLHMLNFTVLFAVLYFLLYKPVKKFNEKRDDFFKEMEQKTGVATQEAQALKEEYEEKMANADAEIEQIKAKASEESKAKADKIISNAKQEANSIIIKARTRANKEKDAIMQSANKEIKQLAEEAAEKIVMQGTLESYDAFLESVEIPENKADGE